MSAKELDMYKEMTMLCYTYTESQKLLDSAVSDENVKSGILSATSPLVARSIIHLCQRACLSFILSADTLSRLSPSSGPHWTEIASAMLQDAEA